MALICKTFEQSLTNISIVHGAPEKIYWKASWKNKGNKIGNGYLNNYNLRFVNDIAPFSKTGDNYSIL